MEKITLTVNDLTKMLGVSAATIYTSVREGDIPHFTVRGRILFNKEVIIAWTKGEYQHEAVTS